MSTSAQAAAKVRVYIAAFQLMALEKDVIVRADGSLLRRAVELTRQKSDPSLKPVSPLDQGTTEDLRQALHSERGSVLERFRDSKIPVLIFSNAFHISADCATPDHILPDRSHCWWPAAHASLAAMGVLGLNLVSFQCENSGRPFINIAPLSGAIATDPNDIDQTLSAENVELMIEKSIEDQSGHTDAVNFPFPEEFASAQNDGRHVPSPAPDFVVLLGVRNVGNVPTYVSALHHILDQLSKTDQAALRKPHYVISGQTTFRTAYVAHGVPVLVTDSKKRTLIRFSHSNVQPNGAEPQAAKAYRALCEVARSVRQPVVVGAGDIAFVNNRIALHGRGKVGVRCGVLDRWLIRTYANFESTGGRHFRQPDFMLEC